MRGSIDCKNASKESLSDSGEAIRLVVEDVREDLLEKLAVCESVVSSYIMASVGVTRKEGAASKQPPAIFLLLESLCIFPLGFPCGRQFLERVAAV